MTHLLTKALFAQEQSLEMLAFFLILEQKKCIYEYAVVSMPDRFCAVALNYCIFTRTVCAE